MRIRQVKPGFWSDATLAKLPDPVRLFYIGTWNLADDYGWIAWDTAEAGALLYPFRQPAGRERNIDAWLADLARADRVALYTCGCVHVIRLREHQRVSGVQSSRVRDLHAESHKDATRKVLSATRPPTKREPLSDSPGSGKGNGVGNALGSTRPFAPLPRPRAREAAAS